MSARAFDVQYTQGTAAKWRLVYAADAEAAKLSVIRSTWDRVAITDVRPIVERLRPTAKPDWSAV